jgi:protein-disulfide isomerase
VPTRRQRVDAVPSTTAWSRYCVAPDPKRQSLSFNWSTNRLAGHQRKRLQESAEAVKHLTLQPRPCFASLAEEAGNWILKGIGGPMTTHLRTALDILSTVAIIVACAALVLALVARDQAPTGSPADPSTSRLPDQPVSIAGAPTKGLASARVVLIEYSEFQCPYCQQFVQNTLPRLTKDYIDTGRMRIVFRHFPLERIHPLAMAAAVASECASRQGRFWEMHDRLFAGQAELVETRLLPWAVEIGADAAEFRECAKGPLTGLIRKSLTEARALGVRSTPFFFVGVAQPDGRVAVTGAIRGSRPYEDFSAALDPLLDVK